jgi:hypothetical protein
MHHALSVKVRKLDWEGLEGVSIGDMVLNGCLEFVIGKGLPGDSLELVVGQSGG